MIKYFFRSPVFPVICDVGKVLVGADSPEQLETQLASLDLPAESQLPLVDASAEGWVFDTTHQVVSPLTFKKRWTKKEVIAMFNASTAARKLGEQYSERSLSAKRFDRIMGEIVALIAAANNDLRFTK